MSASKHAFIRDELAGACTLRRLADAVVRIHAQPQRIHGSPKFCQDLPRHGLSAHRNTVARNIQGRGIRARYAWNWRPSTTQGGHSHAASPDLVNRDFGAEGPNRKLMCDISCILTGQGFPYLAGGIGAWSRSIAGWSMSDSLHASVTPDALRVAIVRRIPPRGRPLRRHGDG